MLALNQVLAVPTNVKDEIKKDIRPVIDLGELVRHIKTDLEFMGVNLEAVEKISRDEVQNMTAGELRAKVMH